MIDIRLLTDGKQCRGFISRGHAGFADEGNDIICSAVSVLLINTVNSVEAFTDDAFTVDEDDGYLCMKLSGEVSEKASLLLDALALGLHSIEETYGRSFLKVGEMTI